MNDMIVRTFALDIDKNARAIAELTKQVKKLKRRNFILGLLCVGTIGAVIFLDKYIEDELNKYQSEE